MFVQSRRKHFLCELHYVHFLAEPGEQLLRRFLCGINNHCIVTLYMSGFGEAARYILLPEEMNLAELTLLYLAVASYTQGSIFSTEKANKRIYQNEIFS